MPALTIPTSPAVAPAPGARGSVGLQPARLTVAQFNYLGDLGWFEGRRPVLLGGVILEQGPMDPPHAIVLGLVQRVLQTVFGPEWWVRGQSPLHVDAFNDPMPDFAVVAGGPRDYQGRHPMTASLVVEVADTTLDVDDTAKAERYATAGVADYWVIDVTGRRLLVFRNPGPIPDGGAAYRDTATLTPTDRIAPLAAPQAAIPVGDLLP